MLDSPASIRLLIIFRFFSYWLQCEKLRAEATMLPSIRAELEALRRRHSAALELMGERDEEVHIFLYFGFSLLRQKFQPAVGRAHGLWYM